MASSLSDAAVSGVLSNVKIATPEQELLAAGDITGLIALKHSIFGNSRMDGDGDDDGDDGDDDGDDGDDDGGDDGDDDADPRDQEIIDLKAENKRRRIKAREQDARIKELEKNKGKAPAKDKDKDGGDGDEDAPTAAQLRELEGDREALMSDNDKLRIQLAFTQNTKYSWKNPAAALKLADLSDVDINDDGKVEGLEDALDALAESDPYLLNDDKDSEDDGDDEKPKSRPRTGQPTGRSRKRKTAAPDREALRNRYPALRNR